MKSRLQALRIPIFVLVLMIAIGATFFAFNRIDVELRQEYDAHLFDLGKSVDRNLENILARCRYEVQRELSRPRVTDAITHMEQTGDSTDLEESVRNSFATHEGLLSSMIVFYKDTQLFCTNCESISNIPEFLHMNSADGVGLIRESDGKHSIAFTQESGDFTFIGVMDLSAFYDSIVVDSLQSDYWIILYDSDSGIIMENDGNTPTYHSMPEDEMLGRGDGYSIVAEADQIGGTVTDTYAYTDPDSGHSIRCRIFAYSSESNRNAIFTLGIAANYNKLNVPILHTNAWLILSICLIIADTIGISVVLGNIIKRYRNVGKQLKETQARLDQQEEAAHSQRLELMGTMTGAISHEFNNLLTPIMGYSLMLLETIPETDERYNYVAEIYRSAERSKEMITRFSALTRKNTGASYTEFAPDDLMDKAARIAETSRPEGVQMTVRAGCAGTVMKGSETQIIQVLLNLILNAFQSMESGAGHVEVSSELRGGNVVFTVSDDGPGVPEELRERVFEPFFTTKEPGKGTGLGLAISRKVAEAHGGTLSVASSASGGAEFTLTLPVK